MKAQHSPTAGELESLGEHALLKTIPDSTRITAHWIIARSKLIAAAPELLEACKEAIQWLAVIPAEYRNRKGYPLELCRAAIASATGKGEV